MSRKSVLTIAIAIAIALAAAPLSPALARDGENAAIIGGLVGAALLGSLLEGQPPAAVYVPPPPVYEPDPPVVYYQPAPQVYQAQPTYYAPAVEYSRHDRRHY